MKKPLKIGFISTIAPNDRKGASGTNYKVCQQLAKFAELKWIPIQKNKIRGKIIHFLSSLYKSLTHKNLNTDGIKFLMKFKYKNINISEFDDCDIFIVFFSLPMAVKIKSSKPIVQITDGTFPVMIDYYPEWSNLANFNKKDGIKLEKEGADNSKIIIYPSKWAANSAINDLQQDPQKIKIVEFGANIDEKDIIKEKRFSEDQLEILFLGIDWERKGGEIAVETVEWLNRNGVKAFLNIVGPKNLDSKYQRLPFVRNYGFLNKNNEGEYNTLASILKKSNILLLPTKAECAGIAFSEACANSLPIFTYNTGGVSNYVLNGINGFMLPLEASGNDFGKKIKEIYESGKIKEISERAFQIYNEKLNWNVWGKKVKDLLETQLK